MARAAATSSWSMSTRTVWRRRIGAWAALGASRSSSSASVSYWRLRRTKAATMTGTSTMMNQAPCVNFVMAMITSTIRQRRADAVDGEADTPVRLTVREVVLGHTRLRQREAREDPDRVERDQPVDLRVGDEQDEDRGDGQEDDPVREHQAMPAIGEMTRHEVVFRVEARETGKVGEARVRREHEDQHRSRLEPVEEHVTECAAPIDETTDLADDGRCALFERRGVDFRCEHREAEEHDAERAAHDHERDPSVLPRRLAKRGHAVGDGLDARHGGTARRERVQHDEHRRPQEHATAR